MQFPNLSLVPSPARRLDVVLPVILAAIGLLASPVLADWPIIDPVTPITCVEGCSFTITGHHFGDDVLDLIVVIREPGLLDGATTTITSLDVLDPNTSPPTHGLSASLDPVGRHFTGNLELHVVEHHPIPNGLMIRGPREYHLSDIRWIESVCYVPGGSFTILPPAQSGQVSEPGVPNHLLMRDPMTAMNSTVILSSDPPPDCRAVDLQSGVDPLEDGGFFASITLTRTEGPAPTPTEWRGDLAAAIQQAFSAYGVTASTHPDGVAIVSSSGLAGGFAVLFTPPEP